MRVFMTGATGYIGSAVAHELARTGHEVVALAHRQEAEAGLRAVGFEPVAGDLRSPGGWLHHLHEADAVIHAGNTGGADAAETDEAATEAIVERLEGTDKALVYTSGVWVVGDTRGRTADENAPTRSIEVVGWRPSLEARVKAAAARGVRTVVVRPGIVFGRGGGIPGMLKRGELPIVGSGEQVWPLVHVDDLAVLYRLAVERAPGGSVLHGVSHHATMTQVARAVGVEDLREVPLTEAREALGSFADALALDQRVASETTRQLTGWEPARPWPAAVSSVEGDEGRGPMAAGVGRSL